MRIHILGVCGTFMGGVAILAKQLGYEVSGSDLNVYPPMSNTLRAAGIDIQEGYEPAHLKPHPDVVLIGNALSRGNSAVEYVLNNNLRYRSGPQWLAEEVLCKRHVLAVSGTHGKTTVTSLLTWILHQADLNPGYLVGGVPQNFNRTAHLGGEQYFVIEADEYDTAFFDKRSKFIHYHPKTLIVNNLEYDHADIFPDLEAIKRQFHFLMRTVPGCGSVIYPHDDVEIQDVLARGCWSTQISTGAPEGIWQAKNSNQDGSQFDLWHRDQKVGAVKWKLLGQHNVKNALTAIAAAHEVGVNVETATKALASFKGIKRRLEIRGEVNGITIYDDFAHHPTAIATTIAGLRAKVGQKRIIAVVEFGSNTMKMGVHRDVLAQSLREADQVVMLKSDSDKWNIDHLVNELGTRSCVQNSVENMVNYLEKECHIDDHVLIMSNKGFGGIHQRLLDRLEPQGE